MNVIGSMLTITKATDPAVVGRSGTVVLETMKTLLLATGPKTFRVAKAGSEFTVSGSGTKVTGLQLAGRLEDRWGAKQ